MDILNLTVGAELGAGRAENRVEARAERSGKRALQKNDGAERGAGTERRAGITDIGWSVERLFRRSAHNLTCSATVQCNTVLMTVILNTKRKDLL